MHEAREAEHEVEADSHCIKLPALRKSITDERLDGVGNAQYQKIQHDQLEYPDERRLKRLLRTKEAKYGFGEIRKIRAEGHERNDHPASGSGVH